MHAVLWQGDARRGTPPNSAPLSTARWSACLLKKRLLRATAGRSHIASGGLSLRCSKLGLVKWLIRDCSRVSTGRLYAALAGVSLVLGIVPLRPRLRFHIQHREMTAPKTAAPTSVHKTGL